MIAAEDSDLCRIWGTKVSLFWKLKMKLIWLIPFLFVYGGSFGVGRAKNVSSRPAVVNIGAIFTLDSTIGRVAKIAIDEAVKDVNSNPDILRGTKLVIEMQNSNCSGFLGMVEGTLIALVYVFIVYLIRVNISEEKIQDRTEEAKIRNFHRLTNIYKIFALVLFV